MKGILKHLVLTLGRYEDAQSRRAVENVIKALAANHLEKTTKAFIITLTDLAEQQKKLKPW